MPGPLPLSNREKVAVAIGLTWAAGAVDVIGYLALYHAFVAHMSGNTVDSVLQGTQHHWLDLLHRGFPIPAFFLGLLLGELVLESGKRRKVRHMASRALWIEAACLMLFLSLGLSVFGVTPRIRPPSSRLFMLLVGLIAVAMGVQSASLRKIGALTIFTTFITGTLTKLANDLSEYLFWLRDRTHGRIGKRLGPALRLSARQESFQAVVLLTALYLAYATGAMIGAVGFQRWGLAMTAAPLALVLAAIALDWARPISPIP